MKSPASVCFFCCHKLIGTETGDSPEQSRNNGVFHPKRECGLRNTKGKAKTDLASRGSVMYWPGAPALGQSLATAFICQLHAAHTGAGSDPSSVRTTQCVSLWGLKEQKDFSPPKGKFSARGGSESQEHSWPYLCPAACLCCCRCHCELTLILFTALQELLVPQDS